MKKFNQYKRIANERRFQQFDDKYDFEEDIIGKPKYVAIDGILYERKNGR